MVHHPRFLNRGHAQSTKCLQKVVRWFLDADDNQIPTKT